MCVCHQVTFKELKCYVNENDMDFEELLAEKRCCLGCRLCRPYIVKMLCTGETAFAPGDYFIK